MVMLGVVGTLIAFLFFITTRITAPNMEVLYRGLAIEDSGQIVSKLEAMNVPYELRGNGAEILVPSNEMLRLRVTLAQEGLPAGGSVGYELFDRGQALGTTSFVQNLNRVRALEGELARTIRSIDRVAAARVHLVLPKRRVFSREKTQPTASIILKMRGNTRLDKSQVMAIQHLVAAAVPGLEPNRISIVDGRGTLLARGGGQSGGAQGTSTLEEMRMSTEQRLERAIEELLQRAVGLGNVRAEVTADIDFDRTTLKSEEYDPEGQVVRSTQTIEEKAEAADREAQEPVSVAGNLPNAETGDLGAAGSSSSNSRIEETVNYEISKKVETRVHETGTIRRLSVAVLVNGKLTVKEDGTRSYDPRSKEELDQLAALVRSAIGFDEKRGDTVEVVNMQFTELADIPEQIDGPSLLGLTKNDYFRIAELLVLTVVGILVLLLVVRPLVSRGLSIAAEAVAHSNAAEQLPGIEDAGALIGTDGEVAAQLPAGESASAPDEPESLIDLDRIEGQVKASSVKKIGELVDKHPTETVSILRNWLYQDA